MLPALAACLVIASVALPAPETGTGAQGATETLADVRFHGNYSIPDDELLRLIGVEVGDPLDDETLALIEQRLRADERIDTVELRKRYRSLSRTDQVALLIVVKEQLSVPDKLMFLPVLTWTDEYGVTYGARVTTIDLLGLDERLSFPLTWGGEKRAGAEVGFELDLAALSRVRTGVEIVRRENPHFDLDDTRLRVWGEGAKRWGITELAGRWAWEDVDFDGLTARQLSYGVGARLDTRQDTLLPRNAVYVGGDWDRLELLDETTRGINRYTADLRGYKSLVGRSILAGQALWRGADRRLPDYERAFLGGARTVRGYDAGEFIGDNLVLLSAELRVPLTPPAQVGLLGLNFFFDSGTVYDHGTDLGKARFRHGVGAGVYVFAAFVGFKLDIAYDLEDDVHFHFGTGFRF